MKPNRIVFFWILAAFSQAFSLLSCSKKEVQTENQLYLTVGLPRAELKNETYYLIDSRESSIELDFSLPVDISSVADNVIFSDLEVIPGIAYETVVTFNPADTMPRYIK